MKAARVLLEGCLECLNQTQPSVPDADELVRGVHDVAEGARRVLEEREEWDGLRALEQALGEVLDRL